MKTRILLNLIMVLSLGACAHSSLQLTQTSPPLTGELPQDSIYNLDSNWKDQNGRPTTLSGFRGKPVVISMVYLKCQFSCPLTVAQMKEVEKKLTPEARKATQLILVSFDPVRDTPEAMLKYAKKNKIEAPQWTFLTGENETKVRELSALINFKYKKLDSGEYEHSYALIALDRDGRIVSRTEGAEMSPDIIADKINDMK